MPLDDHDPHLLAIRRLYGDRRARRSGVLLMAHVVEGLLILDELSASTAALQAFCLHPIVQADGELAAAFVDGGVLVDADVSPFAVTLALEYRRCANAHLSMHAPETLAAVSLAPFDEVRLMLVADKVQNRRDFERHHLGMHPRSAELDAYFRRWLAFLDVDEPRYRSLVATLASSP
jgi:hypothetical protein